jgi:tagaturonate epimerase
MQSNGIEANREWGALRMDPAANPAVLDTATWDPFAAAEALGRPSRTALDGVARAMTEGRRLPTVPGLVLHEGSRCAVDGAGFVLAGLPDGQQVLLEVGRPGGSPTLGEALAKVTLDAERSVVLHATSAANLRTYLRDVAPDRGPRALGDTPRIGFGVRMTTAAWPAIFRAMESRGFSANAIQNSVRELNLLDDLLEGRPAATTYYTGFGMIESGHTGSSIEGLWVAGVLEALKHPTRFPYGADADHLHVKRGPDGLARARRYVDSYRGSTFYSLDMSDILDYGALNEPSSSASAERALAAVGDDAVLRSIVAYHRRRDPGKGGVQLSEAMIHRMIAKYWGAFEAMTATNDYVHSKHEGVPYDLEFTIDEHPPEIAAFDCLTAEEECTFVLDEVARRGLPVTHLAPNVGIEKGFDYRGTDGLEGLERRLTSIVNIADRHGVVIDIHSADDLTAPSRAAIRRATKGRLHYKISPLPQILFAEVAEQVHPDFFAAWWGDAVQYAREAAAAGSPFAAACLAELATKASSVPSCRDQVFHHYCFRFVGRRDENGQYLGRHRFYSLSDEFYRQYQDRLTATLEGLADELLL